MHRIIIRVGGMEAESGNERARLDAADESA